MTVQQLAVLVSAVHTKAELSHLLQTHSTVHCTAEQLKTARSTNVHTVCPLLLQAVVS
jgi:hypothetical protein